MKKYFTLWPLFFISHLFLVFLISWHLLAQINFAYPVAYNIFNIDQHIARYAPENRYKKHFEYVSSTEHKRAFAEISHAINHGGQDLEKIYYTLPNGSKTPLMHEAEIVHLQDVAKLIDFLNTTGLFCLAFIVLFSLYAIKKKLPLPKLKHVFLGFGIGTSLLILMILTLGSKQVFYVLHTWIFPKDHIWFFYYQDSLMTTLMKAPDIFAFITILLLVLSAFIWIFSLLGFARIFNSKAISP